MKCPSHEMWDLLAIKAIGEEQAEALLEHAGACAGCREQLAAARRAHVERVRMYEVFDRNHDRLREQLLTALPAEPAGATGGLRIGGRIGEWIMSVNTRTTRRMAAVLAPAACIVIALGLLLTSGQKSAFAAAIERMREAHTIVAKVQSFLNGGETPMQTGMMYLSDEDGMRFDSETNVGFGAPANFSMAMYRQKDGPIIAVQPGLKFVMKMHVPPGYTNLGGLSGGFDPTTPDAFLAGFRNLTGDADKLLGRSKMDGVEVEGFEVSARKLGIVNIGAKKPAPEDEGFARLWVDAKTHLPVRMEMEMTQEAPMVGKMRIKATFSEITFNKTLDPQMFVPQIPADCRVIELTVPERSEATLIEALRIFKDATGQYPAALDPAQVSGALSIAMATKGQIKIDPNDPSSFMSSDMMQATMTVAMGCTYVAQLDLEGRQPAYFGDSVTPQDAKEALVEWTLPSGERRVIYGDLHVATVAAK